MTGSCALNRGSPSCVAISGSSARSSCQVVSNSLSSGALAGFLAARAASVARIPSSGTSRASVLRRIHAFSATQALSGKGFAAHMPHRGTEPQQLDMVDMRIAGHEFDIRVVQEGGKETPHAVESLPRARRVLHLPDDFRLPMLRARLDLAQLHEAAVEQQQIGG